MWMWYWPFALPLYGCVESAERKKKKINTFRIANKMHSKSSREVESFIWHFGPMATFSISLTFDAFVSLTFMKKKSTLQKWKSIRDYFSVEVLRAMTLIAKTAIRATIVSFGFLYFADTVLSISKRCRRERLSFSSNYVLISFIDCDRSFWKLHFAMYNLFACAVHTT